MRLKLQGNLWAPAAMGLTVVAVTAAFQNCSNVDFAKYEAASTISQEQGGMSGVPAPDAPLCVDISQNLQPALSWDWYAQLGPNDFRDFSQVMASPVVGDLRGDGHPSVAFVSWTTKTSQHFDPAFAGSAYSKNGVLRVVDGKTGVNKISVAERDVAPFATTTPLLTDLDGDGRLEIIYMNYLLDTVIALNSDGTTRWKWALPKTMNRVCQQGLSTSDLDLNGRAEVIVGGWVIEETAGGQPALKMTFNANPATLSCGAFSTVLDPAHPSFSIVDIDAVYDSAGVKRFSLGSEFGYLAVGKVRADLPGNQIVKTAYNGSNAHIRIYDGISGSLLNDVDLLALAQYKCSDGTIGGGPASIGDFLGNGGLQIAVASGQYLMIFDGKGGLLASYRTQDCSSRVTGVTAFDFDGDGKPEILYGDEEYFRIFHYNAGNLEVLFKTPNPSGTLLEYPVVADIEGDGNSKLVVVSNNYAVPGFYRDPGEENDASVAAGITGVRAFKSGDGLPWMKARKSWNQYHYNAGLMNDAGRVFDPAVASQSWLGKTFKLNSQISLNQPICRR